MQRSKRFLFTFLALGMPLASGGASWGQVFPIQFNLSTPGARSLGMGGAFLALADDATAAYTNPAGLTSLTEGGPQVAVELRDWSYLTPYVAEGRLDGTANEVGLDFFDQTLSAKAESEVSDLSFASLGYVLRGGLALALYKNQLANFATSFRSQGLFYDAELHGGYYYNPENPTWRTPPYVFGTKVKVDSLGAAIAKEFRKPFHSKIEQPLSVGLGITQYKLASSLGILYFGFNPPYEEIDDPLISGADGIFGRSQFLPGNIVALQAETGDDSAIGMTYGFLWKLGKQANWAVGGVYREGPKFVTQRAIIDGENEREFDSTLKIPDIYGIGVSYSPPRNEGRTKIALDYQSIRYSQRLGDFFTGDSDPSFDISDAQELHLGAERVVVTSGRFVGTARAGAWRESPHELEYKGPDPSSKALFPSGRANTHWAAGLGLVIGESYQIDAAVDRSNRVNTFSFSVVRFF